MKKVLIALLLIFVAIQFVRPARNLSGEKSMDIGKKYPLPDSVAQIFEKACYDCHSNSTRYPWYANVQPVSWWLANHIKDGKRHFNFNTFLATRVAAQVKHLDECIDQVDKGEMPLESYTWIHKDAILTATEKATIKGWLQSVVDTIKASYPADSLKLPPRKRPN